MSCRVRDDKERHGGAGERGALVLIFLVYRGVADGDGRVEGAHCDMFAVEDIVQTGSGENK